MPLVLAGCAAPGVIGVASYGFDGFSYAATGKSVSDEAISQARDQNCSTWRLLVARSICRDLTPEERREIATQQARIETRDVSGTVGEPKYDRVPVPVSPEKRTLVAAGPDRTISTSVGALRPAAETTVVREPIDPGFDRSVDKTRAGGESIDPGERYAYGSGKAARRPIKIQPTPSAAPRPAIAAARPMDSSVAPSAPLAMGTGGAEAKYLVLASFASRSGAEEALARYPDARPRLAVAVVGGRVLHRVVSGPYSGESLAAARNRVSKAYGIENAWTLPGCIGAAASGCITAAARDGATQQIAARP